MTSSVVNLTIGDFANAYSIKLAERRLNVKTNLNKLKGKIAFITGGASGIGLAIARRFVDEDAQVVIADLDSAQYYISY